LQIKLGRSRLVDEDANAKYALIVIKLMPSLP